VPVLGRPEARFQPLWIEDLAAGIVSAIDDERLDGRSIPLGGAEYVTMREILQTIAKALHRRRLLAPLPLPVARVQAHLMSVVLPKPPLTPATLELFSFENATDLDAYQRAFGTRPRGFREHVLAHGVDG
jgi:NADH dehydrogenase